MLGQRLAGLGSRVGGADDFGFDLGPCAPSADADALGVVVRDMRHCTAWVAFETSDVAANAAAADDVADIGAVFWVS